jgi:hypothetical protein
VAAVCRRVVEADLWEAGMLEESQESAPQIRHVERRSDLSGEEAAPEWRSYFFFAAGFRRAGSTRTAFFGGWRAAASGRDWPVSSAARGRRLLTRRPRERGLSGSGRPLVAATCSLPRRSGSGNPRMIQLDRNRESRQ